MEGDPKRRGSFKTGKTIIGARGRERAVELERIERRKKARLKRGVVWAIIGALTVVAVIWVGLVVVDVLNDWQKVETIKEEVWAPTTEVVSEGGGQVSVRVNEFVARLEQDFSDFGHVVARVVLPLNMMREADVYVEGRKEYYKMSIDRGSAVQVEDAERMMRYLDERGIEANYVDLRVEGKAYYK
jgi:hypothetical protein